MMTCDEIVNTLGTVLINSVDTTNYCFTNKYHIG